MSSFLGKLIYKISSPALDDADADADAGSVRCFVSYVESKKRFRFRLYGLNKLFNESERSHPYLSFSMNSGLVKCCTDLKAGMCPFWYKWSIGYSTKFELDATWANVKEVRMKEMEVLGGRKNLIMNDEIDSDDHYDWLSVIQYLFCLSRKVLCDVERQWKRKKWGKSDDRWVELKRRPQNYKKPRKKRRVTVTTWEELKEMYPETYMRIKHNKKAGAIRRVFWWFQDAYEEECRVFGRKFNLQKCKEEYRIELSKYEEVSK